MQWVQNLTKLIVSVPLLTETFLTLAVRNFLLRNFDIFDWALLENVYVTLYWIFIQVFCTILKGVTVDRLS